VKAATKFPFAMYRSFLSVGLLAFALQTSAQSEVHQVVVLNEGYYDYFGGGGQLVPVTLGSYDPAAGTYQTRVTLQGPRFGTDVLVDDGSIYVAADDRILRFDADNYSLLDEAIVTGVRKLAVWNDQLLVTRGELGGLSHYFETRSKADLSFIAAITPADGLSFSAEGIVVFEDKAYLAVNNSFDYENIQGLVGVVDLNTGSFGSMIDLGEEGLNPEHLMVKDGSIYAFSNKDFTGSSISRISNGDLDYVRTVADNSGCSASALVGSSIYYMEYEQQELARFDLSSGEVLDTLSGSPSVYGLLADPINNVVYATTTDYYSTGELHVMEPEGTILHTVSVSVSPGNMALDIRNGTGTVERARPAFGVYPNPVQDRLTITGEIPSGAVMVDVSDAMGRTVLSSLRSVAQGTTLDLGMLSSGVYSIRLDHGPAVRFVKK
jgi:hypothetical protein